FLFFFLSESSAPARRFQSRSIFLPGRCLAATCTILQDDGAFVNTFSQKLQSFLSSCSKTKNAPITRYVILAIGGGTEI
ncbi:hypothetical protein, partial [uncultured Mitsuokella sp.]|uniref:hypothetical protein n=2 Tax=Mitsuokella TaxID=52225 RepID=UPI00258D4642